MKNEDPDYKRIYKDIIALRYPEKKVACQEILKKRRLISLDVLQLNIIIFGHKSYNQKYKSYDKETIYEILEFQKKEQCSNSQLASHFNLSRNTITKWKKTMYK